MNYKVYLYGELYNQNQQTSKDKKIDLVGAELNLDLTSLTQGKHTIRVDVDSDYTIGVTGIDIFYVPSHTSAEVNFFVYRGIQPQVAISGLGVYEPNKTVFNITTNEPDANISYSLDGAANVTLPQNESAPRNLTLTDLHSGPHTLTVYVKDTFNQTAKSEKTFTVEQPMPLSTLAAAAVSVAVAVVVGAGLLVYFKKRKHHG